MTKAKAGTKVEMVYELKDKDGNPKKIWSENKIGQFLREWLKKDVRIPFLLGKWVYTIKRKARYHGRSSNKHRDGRSRIAP